MNGDLIALLTVVFTTLAGGIGYLAKEQASREKAAREAAEKQAEAKKQAEPTLQQLITEHTKHLMAEQQRRIDTLHARVEKVEEEREAERREFERILRSRDERIAELEGTVKRQEGEIEQLRREIDVLSQPRSKHSRRGDE